jgi:RimJ/RimL family protein N-acetyltransferase
LLGEVWVVSNKSSPGGKGESAREPRVRHYGGTRASEDRTAMSATGRTKHLSPGDTKRPGLPVGRIALRKMSSRDSFALGLVLRDRRATRFLPPRVRRETGPQFVSRVLKEQRRGDGIGFAIRLPKTRETIGQVRLMDWSRPDRRAEVGIWIGREFWGRGFGTDALRLACQYGFRSMRLHRISAAVVVGNDRSDRMLRKVGFRKEGLLREAARAGRGWTDVCVYGITAEEFRRSQTKSGQRA